MTKILKNRISSEPMATLINMLIKKEDSENTDITI